MSEPLPTTVLNVDDNDAQRYATTRILERAGFRVREARNGAEALRLAGEQPDVIVLDVSLPDVNGFEVCRRIKADAVMQRIPVLQISALFTSGAARAEGLSGGADGYLVQPIEPEELIATVQALLRSRRAEDALRASEERYRLLFDASPTPIWVADREAMRFLMVNATAVQHYGYSEEEFLGMHLAEIRPAEDVADFEQQWKAGFDGPGKRVPLRHRKKDGSVIQVEVTWRDLEFGGRAARMAMVNDVTEQRRAEDLRHEQQLRTRLLERVLLAQEEERRRIARELHDEAGQLLASLLVGLRTIEDTRRLRAAKTSAKHLRELTARAMDDVGRLARGLHPTVLDDLGLVVALRKLAEDFSATHGVQLELGLPENAEFSPEVEIGLYRIAQEALTNVARHAGATQAAVELRCDRGKVRLRVSDNGRGFDASARLSGAHLGLQGMRERAAILGGHVRFESAPGGDTTVTAEIPLDVPVKADEVTTAGIPS